MEVCSTSTPDRTSISTFTSDDEYMIALYYWYIDIPTQCLDEHCTFHQEVCTNFQLFGRIRVSSEGLNGVLSGKATNLKLYEKRIRSEVEIKFRTVTCNSGGSSSLQYGEILDVKYCRLRKDIPLQKQLFNRLSIKVTKEVVSLHESTCMKKAQGSIGDDNGDDNDDDNTNGKESNYQSAKHLSPKEWNEHLLSYRSTGRPSNMDNKDASIDYVTNEGVGTLKGENTQPNDDAILIDVRNIYESKIGYFSSENIPTLLTNTRQYSSTIPVFKESIPHLAGKNVYMYCTGGVRCERASAYLQELADSTEWPDNLEKPKSIYQLEGGIQKYLETYGRFDGEDKFQITSDDREIIIKNEDMEHKMVASVEKIPEICLYEGKNFVFDPRRIDPMVGSNNSIVGKCIICKTLCDDYDHNHAPSDHMESRCCVCRVLVLVCNQCRQQVRVWGQQQRDNGDVSLIPELFCGPRGKECIQEGTIVEHFDIIHRNKVI